MSRNVASSHRAVDRDQFRAALGLFPTGVAVVTADAGNGEQRIGMTITSFNSVSLDPPLVLFSIGKNSLSLPRLCRAAMYSINVLGEQHRHLSTRFATVNGDKWTETEVETYDGLPFTLKHSLVSFQCVSYAQHDGGDHIIFVGQVQRIQQREESAPLVFFRGNYASLQAASVVRSDRGRSRV